MLQPVRHTWKHARPTGLGLDPSAYSRDMRASWGDRDNPVRGMYGVGEGPRPRAGKQWPRYLVRAMSGLGLTDQQITATAGSTAATIAAMIPGVGPIAAVAIQAAATVAVAIESLFAGCGSTCTQASNIANEVGNQMSSAMSVYMNSTVHTQAMQAAFLTLYDSAWAQLEQACGNAALGAAGQRCISDRQAGACTWKCSAFGWNQTQSGAWTYTWAGPAGSGDTCWNWFNGMRDPVANDPTVVPDTVATVPNGQGGRMLAPGATGTTGASAATTAGTNTAASTVAGIPLPLVLGGAFLLLVLAVEG